MTKTMEATFDGHVFRPDQPINLKPNTRVVIRIETTSKNQKKSKSFLKIARQQNIEGPEDWSEKIDEYLYEK